MERTSRHLLGASLHTLESILQKLEEEKDADSDAHSLFPSALSPLGPSPPPSLSSPKLNISYDVPSHTSNAILTSKGEEEGGGGKRGLPSDLFESACPLCGAANYLPLSCAKMSFCWRCGKQFASHGQGKTPISNDPSPSSASLPSSAPSSSPSSSDLCSTPSTSDHSSSLSSSSLSSSSFSSSSLSSSPFPTSVESPSLSSPRGEENAHSLSRITQRRNARSHFS